MTMAACAEVADAFAHRAQAGDAILGMGGAGFGNAGIECVELGFAVGAGGDGSAAAASSAAARKGVSR